MPADALRKQTALQDEDPHETTPLLTRSEDTQQRKWPKSIVYRVLFTSFLVSTSFGVTQVPIIYIFGLMTCDEYYRTHSGLADFEERCKIPAIEAGTARAVALMGASTTLFGVLNLFIAGWAMKAFGIKRALVISIFWPAIRLFVQNIGVEVGAGLGVIIMQLSQILTIPGGPVGYLLALNSYLTEIVEPAERTAALGRLQGCAMFGTSLGFLAGGLIGDLIDIKAPFRVTLLLFVISSIWCALILPPIPLDKEIEKKATKSLSAFLDPIRMFKPAKWLLPPGKVRREYGILLLGVGIFLGVLATSYIPTVLQMYGTDVFGFGTAENGVLISHNSMIRGMFLTFAFPPIIKHGRKWLDNRNKKTAEPNEEETMSSPQGPESQSNGYSIPDPMAPDDIVQTAGTDGAPPVVEPPKPTTKQESFAFDLWFTKYSLITDGILTGACTFVTEPWQMYLVAVVLPLASGTGSAAKGTILQMCTPEQRTDALSAITLVEMLARLSTTAIFGLAFAAFADIGKTYLIFTCNAAIAMLGFVVLLFAQFPPAGASRYTAPKTNDDSDDE